jgi:hypothetical protein
MCVLDLRAIAELVAVSEDNRFRVSSQRNLFSFPSNTDLHHYQLIGSLDILVSGLKQMVPSFLLG